ncbi:MAG: hypothetical protein AAB343_03290 [Patescibacteria group bacterium]
MNLDTVLKADIFFMIAAVSFVILTGAMVFLTIRLMRILALAEDIMSRIKHEVGVISHDVSFVRDTVKEKTANITSLMESVLAMVTLQKIRKSRKRKSSK